jgi:hypothetical protein
MSGCAICVYDLYEESLTKYRESIENIRASLTSLAIPQNEWPSSLLPGRFGSQLSKAASASESAFEALERALAAKTIVSVKA